MADDAIEVDARGLSCPMPLLKARKAIATAAPGQSIVVLATDQGAESDFRAYCERAGHELLSLEWQDDVLRVELARGD
ncbi:sulfurtransferase TusA family protein [Guyparkeria hydrothermalis]|uniref:sulfurtransferase TusA family protein n=1 Tax=Guyparkeria hydrothermalis TaxID=923 RepID=UPI0020227CFD|nr:sulfurtransferase TusA family protein [Guyparkeria hydrothermalis]MCL7745360.1 sulfurtransferase TusA family protein [Guyparkeria hydrothermalis]